MTLKTFACDSIAEKNDFVNHFFPSQEIKKRGELCKHFFTKKIKAGAYWACQPYVDICLGFLFSFLPQ